MTAAASRRPAAGWAAPGRCFGTSGYGPTVMPARHAAASSVCWRRPCARRRQRATAAVPVARRSTSSGLTCVPESRPFWPTSRAALASRVDQVEQEEGHIQVRFREHPRRTARRPPRSSWPCPHGWRGRAASCPRRSDSIWVVISVTGWNRPPTPPDSSVIGLNENVNQVSSRKPSRSRNIRIFSR